MKLEDCVRAIPPAASDKRRDIYDLLDGEFPDARHVNVIAFKSSDKPNVGGNHFHYDTERFLVFTGRMRLLVLEDIRTKERRVWRDLGPGTLITIPAEVAHANVNDPGTVLIGALREGFDPHDINPHPGLIGPDGQEERRGAD